METTVAEHYTAMTERMEIFGGDLLCCHCGLWGPETTSHREGLIRANETLAQGLRPGSGKHFLDSGCGIGGTAIWLAERYGVRVTGVTICEPHIEVATNHAKQRDVAHLVEFHHADFMDLPFPDASFDAVLNHESFCYAPDKLAYLRGVHRVLKPGGRWQALEGLRSGAPLSESQRELHADSQRGWRMPPLEPWREVLEVIAEAGFAQANARDLDAEVKPSTKGIRDSWTLLELFGPGRDKVTPAVREFTEAMVAFDQGLREEVFTYRFLSGTKPEQ